MNPAFAVRYGELERWHWWFRGRQRILETVLQRELGGRLPRVSVSLGCGPPAGLAWLVRFAAQGGYVIGLDSDVAHAYLPPERVHVAVARMECTPLRAACADLVLALDVLEHVADDGAALGEAARLLAPGGLLLVTVPALPSLWGAQDEVSQHQRRYRKATLRAAFMRAGLPTPRITYFNSLLFPPIAAVRWLRRSLRTRDTVKSDFEDNRPGLANDLLAAVFAAERHVLRRAPLPFGVSLLATLHAS